MKYDSLVLSVLAKMKKERPASYKQLRKRIKSASRLKSE